MMDLQLPQGLGQATLAWAVAAVCLGALTRNDPSRPLRLARWALAAQTAAWACAWAAQTTAGWVLGVLALVCASAGHYLLLLGLRGWLGRRPGRDVLFLLCVLSPVGQALAFAHEGLRLVWPATALALQWGLVALAACWTSRKPYAGPWRHLLAAAYGVVAVLALLPVLGPAVGVEPWTPHANALALGVAALAGQALAVATLAGIMAAWRREVEVRLELQAHTDPLTELNNRWGWLKHAKGVMAQAQRQEWAVAVLILDLDHFKRVNDTHGHGVGDQALTVLGQTIKQCIRESDVPGRLGGEEFVLLLPQIDLAGAQALDQRLRAQFRSASQATLGMELNFSSGLAFCEFSKGSTLKNALRQADDCMYQAKSLGRGRLFFNPDPNGKAPTC